MPLLAKNCDVTDTGVLGPGMLTSSMLETNPSRLPVGTSYWGPPDKDTASRVARVMMSAQDTVEGHAASRVFFASSMRS